ncbi:MAG TPA: hypothetical protein VGW37_13815, partial [Terriglobia bacterium]|nr:hypothetical protein [Terriglobia bacterium]
NQDFSWTFEWSRMVPQGGLLMSCDYQTIRCDNERRYGTDIGRIGPDHAPCLVKPRPAPGHGHLNAR